jgi:hypothetical protein
MMITDEIYFIRRKPSIHNFVTKYDKQDQQGKAAFNERKPHTTQQQEPVTNSPGGPQAKNRKGLKTEPGQVNH